MVWKRQLMLLAALVHAAACGSWSTMYALSDDPLAGWVAVGSAACALAWVLFSESVEP